ncbi:MAG TPA: 50S ribosomal protein L21 [Candidatus Dojkabacteria bacterium]|nr:50S ribosomal protein L21 [Candidatus Dojkabacteria bacterium]
MPKNTKENTTNMFVIVDVNGTQLKVEEGKKYVVNKVEGEKGSKYVSEKVLLVSSADNTLVGKPYVEGASVEFIVDSQKKAPKVDTFKYKAKARYRRSYGSRAHITRLEVKKIKLSK